MDIAQRTLASILRSGGIPPPDLHRLLYQCGGVGPAADCAILRESFVMVQCARAGYLQHDQSQHTKAGRRAAELPHGVSLKSGGWALAKDEKPRQRRGRSRR